MLLSYRELWWQKSLSNRLYNYEAHNHERGKIKKVILPRFFFFLERFPLSFQKKMRFSSKSIFFGVCTVASPLFSRLFFSFYLISSTVPFLHSLFFSYLLNTRREKEREREVWERDFTFGRVIILSAPFVCALLRSTTQKHRLLSSFCWYAVLFKVIN